MPDADRADGKVKRVQKRDNPVRPREVAGASPAQSVMQKEVCEHTRLLVGLMDSIPDHIYFKDRDSRFTLINKAVARRFGLSSPDEAIGKSDLDFFTREHAVAALKDEQEVMRTGRPLADTVEKETWPDGLETWVSTTKMPLYGKNGDIIGTYGISRDVTERKRVEEELGRHREHLEELVAERTAELTRANGKLQREIAERKRVGQELRRERDKAQTYLDIAGTMIVVLDRDANVTLINRKGCEILGCSEEEVVGASWVESFIPPPERAAVKQTFQALMDGHMAPGRYFENTVHTKDGSVREVAWHNTILRDEAGRILGTLSSGEDVTDRRRTESALLQSERLQAIGTIAGGVALNFNRILSLIRGHATSIAASFIPDTKPHDDAVEILNATERAGEMTKRLAHVAHAGSPTNEARLETLDLGRVVTETVEVIEQSFAEKDIEIRVGHADRMPLVRADAAHFPDALMAVVINSAEAMPDGGTITIDASEKDVPLPNRKLNPRAEGGAYVALRVRDTGCGMSKEVLNTVFDPFVTTKTRRSAFGLGLPYAQQTLRSFGGWIQVWSREGHGTSVRLFMPRVADGRKLRSGGKARARSDAQRGGVLVVDDEPEALALMSRTLKKAGYRVHEAGTAGEAIALYGRHGKQITLSLIDAVMRGGGGESVFSKIVETEPEATVIMTCGFSREYVKSLLPPGAWGFLRKPFDERQLLSAVNEVLDRSGDRHEE
ncbi:PAS domain S-box protein [Verrucomicrobiota bacterium]